MTILQTNRLTDDQLRDLRGLDDICSAFDGAQSHLSLDNSINCEPDMDCFFLLYEGEALLGLLSIFAPMRGVAEITACVHPEHRQKGHFRELLSCACASLREYGFEKLLFTHEASASAGKAIAQKWGLTVEHSEYLLKYQGEAPAVEKGRLAVRYAQESDLPGMVRLGIETFGETPEDARHMVESSFRDATRLNFVAFADGALVGVGGVSTGEPELYIFGLGVAPQHQNKGFGRIMLSCIVDELQRSYNRPIVMEVDSENARAFHMYITSGFEVQVQYDYYEAQLSDVEKRLK